MDSLIEAGIKLIKKEVKDVIVGLLDANEIVDKILKHLTEALSAKFDPIELPSFEQRFVKRVVAIPVSGKVSLDAGRLQGLSNVQRKGDAQLQLSDGRNGSLMLCISFPVISVVYEATRIRFGIFRQTATIRATIPAIELQLTLTVKKERFQCDDFSFDTGNPEVSVEGVSGVVSWAANKIRKVIQEQIRQNASEKVKTASKEALQLAIANVPIKPI